MKKTAVNVEQRGDSFQIGLTERNTGNGYVSSGYLSQPANMM